MKTSSKRTSRRMPTSFDDYEVHGVKVFQEAGQSFCEQVADCEADFWSLYGHVPGEGLTCIGDFRTRRYAEEIYDRITGCCYSHARQS